MKRKFALGLAIVLAMATLAGCGQSEEAATTETAAETQAAETQGAETEAAVETSGTETEVNADGEAERTTLTVGFDAEFPPYGYRDESGEYVGFDLDLAQEVCDRRGWELVKQPIDWDAKDMELSSGSIDCIWNGFTMNGREDAYTWTVPYVDNSQVFVVATDAGITTPADLAGKVVEVQKDSSALAAMEDEANAELRNSLADLQQTADYNTAFMDLESGAVDCVALDIGVANYQLESRNGEYVMLDEHLSTEQYAVGFLLGNDSLKDAVESTLLEMVEDGTFMTIAEKWGLEGQVSLGK